MSFWKKLAIAAAVVVTVAVVAAAVAVTAGAASGPLCVIGTVLYGAAKGAAIGAFAGAAMSVSGNPMFCFVAGTTVLTTLGKKAIEEIQVGDTVPCVDHITGEIAEKKVVTTTVNKVLRLIELDIDGEIIKCTETHPFQVKGKGWIDACNLNPGDVVYTKNWDTAVVKSVSLLELDEPVEVFNFEVEDCHTYFVGEISLLVHNGCRSKNKLKPDLNAQGDHTVFKRGPDGSINKYATYKQNPKNPTGFDEVLRFDSVG